MSDANLHHEFVMQYLLGELSEDAQCRYGEQYLTDDAMFAELLALEQELIDRYAQGTLTTSQHRCFEAYFLRSRQRQQRVHACLK